MARLQHSIAAQARILLLSNIPVHIFVEGRDVDPYVYGRLCDVAIPGVLYRVVRADEISGTGGGKEVLLRCFERLRRHKELCSNRYTTVFFFDKDLDDLFKTRKRSPHVAYTSTYDIEGLVFRSGDIIGAAAAALTCQHQNLTFIGPSISWCDSVASQWREWLALCLTARRLGAPGWVGYKVHSRVNTTVNGLADGNLVTNELQDISTRSGQSAATTHEAYDKGLGLIDRLISRGRLSIAFKGKWYPIILEAELVTHLNPSQAQLQGFRKTVISCLIQRLDYLGDWAEPFRATLISLSSALSGTP